MNKLLFVALASTTLLLGSCKGGGKPQSTVRLDNEVDTISYAIGLANSPNRDQIAAALGSFGSDSTYVDEFFKGMKAGLEAGDDKRKLAYQMGYQSGMQSKARMFPAVESQIFAGDSTRHLSADLYVKGLMDGLHGVSGLVINGDTLNAQKTGFFLETYMRKVQAKATEKVFGPVRKKNEAFMAKIAKESGIKSLPGGVYYKEIKAGTGASPQATDIVSVSYEGKLISGKIFDSSKDKPVEFPVSGVIPGFSTALKNMKAGSEWIVYIPWNQAYGDQESGPIPPYSTLIFKLKLVSFKAAPKAAPAASGTSEGMPVQVQ